MRATDWEFKNRALVIGLIFGCSFPLYSVDPQNFTDALSHWLAAWFSWDPDRSVRLLLFFAAFLVAVAALIRTWASSYLRASIVYAGDLKTETLVADGPYRHVRNPLYLANVLLAIGMGAMMSRLGFVVAVTAMLVFSYRLILREEAELHASQHEKYERYRAALPRLWPSLLPRIASAGQRPQWIAGLKAESWYWGFAAAVAAYAVTLDLRFFFVILGASVLLFWLGSWLAQKGRS
jgi:protein-S-isoprenylcysteine O-methyltransferase Ste14